MNDEPYTPTTEEVRRYYINDDIGVHSGIAEFDRWLSSLLATARADGDDPIPRYAQLDLWMALFGSDTSEQYEPFRERVGFAECWAWLLAMVRYQADRAVVPLTTEEKK